MTFSLANEFRFCQETIFDSISEECLCFIQKGLQYQYLDLVARKVGSTRVNDKHKQEIAATINKSEDTREEGKCAGRHQISSVLWELYKPDDLGVSLDIQHPV
jgi:hypothetical protein